MPTDASIVWTAHDDVPAAGRIVDDGIGRDNEAAAPLADVKRMSCFAVQPDETVVGGAVGRRWGRCCELQQLWVDERWRRQGIGSGLLQRFEQLGVTRGCDRCYLDTFSFQAPAFYRRHGYQTLAAIDGFPQGIVKYLLCKRIG